MNELCSSVLRVSLVSALLLLSVYLGRRRRKTREKWKKRNKTKKRNKMKRKRMKWQVHLCKRIPTVGPGIGGSKGRPATT